MCSILYGIKALAGQGTSPTTDSYLDQKYFLSKIAPSSTALEVENENYKSAGCQPYFVYFIVLFTGLSISFAAFATAAQSPSLHSKWPLQWSFSLLSTTTSGRRTWI